jgi:hypothetical protein
MQLKKFLPAALGAVAAAQSLTDAIESQNASLSQLSGSLPYLQLFGSHY